MTAVTEDPALNSVTLAAERQGVNAQLEALARRLAQLASPVELLATGETGGVAPGHIGLGIVGELAGVTASLLLLRRDVEHLEDVAWRCGRAAGRNPVVQTSHVRVLR